MPTGAEIELGGEGSGDTLGGEGSGDTLGGEGSGDTLGGEGSGETEHHHFYSGSRKMRKRLQGWKKR
jgi:hypothetical protein